LVEFNALWYNALCFASEMAAQVGRAELQTKYSELAQKAGTSFVEVFRNDYGYLYDFVDGQAVDWSVRPNQICCLSRFFTIGQDAKKAGTRHRHQGITHT